MLRGLRERTKTILWIVVAAFVISIFAVWGMDLRGPSQRKFDTNVVGSIDKLEISQQSYNDMLNQLYTQLKTQKGESYSPNEMERSLLADQAWELTVQGRLMQKEIAKLRLLTVTDGALVSFLRQNPHPSLQNVFKTEDGQFDYQAYLKALADPEVDWTELERWGRMVIPEMKLQTYLLAQVHIPESDVLERFRQQSAVTKARYVEIPIQIASAPFEPGDAELKAFYEEKKDNFKSPAMRRVRVIEIDKKATAADEEDVRARLADVRADIVKGTLDFAEAAKDYSDDETTRDKAGDLGFFKKGDMTPDFEKVAFSIKPGELSEPFRTQLGYHILEVEGRKTERGIEQVHARHILMKVVPGTDTVDSLQTVLRDISTEIHKKGFEKTATERKLKTFDSEPFPQGMFIKNLGFAPRIVSFAFNYGPGRVSYGIDSESAVYLVKILEEIPARVKPFEEVRPQLVEEIRANRDAEAARAVAESIRKEIIAGGFEAVARAKNLTAKETPAFKDGDQIPEIGTNTAFHVACKYLAVNAVSPPVRGQGRYYIITVVERGEPDMAKYADARQGIIDAMRNELANRFMANWYQGVRDKAKVEDLRERPLQ
jgi:peptidyl-prolyl cis-trans isomerase D